MSKFDLDRFVQAQRDVYAGVVGEISAGRKRSHWMWVIFPQITGLGFSAMTQRYAIQSRSEAHAYLDHDLLGVRLAECTQLVLAVRSESITQIFGQSDDVKFRSSMTLFAAVSHHRVFDEAIEKFFIGGRDPKTLELLEALR